MALVLKDRVKETTTTTGTGTVTLAGAVTGFQSFSAIGNTNTTYYCIAGTSQWEVGIGTYTSSGTTLSRDTILESSNSGSAVNFSAGTKDVFVVYPAEKSVYQEGLLVKPNVAPGYGGTLSNNATDATNDIDIAAGARWDSTYVSRVNLAAMTKRLDANWTAGTGNGMRYSGAAIADTTYHIFAVWTVTGTQDYYAYPGATDATVLAALQAETGGSAYVYLQRMGAIVRSSGSILAFFQVGKEFYWKLPALDVSTSNPGTSAVTRTLRVPTGKEVMAIFSARVLGDAAGATGATYISSLDATDSAPSGVAAPLVQVGSQYTSAADGLQTFAVKTNTSAQLRTRAVSSAAGVGFYMSAIGWNDYQLGGF